MSLPRLARKQKPKFPVLDETAQSRELILKFLLIFTLIWLLAATVIMLINMTLNHNYMWPLLLASGTITAMMAGFYFSIGKGFARFVSYVLVSLYLGMVIGVYLMWGVNNLQALLLAAFVIIISGILLSARYALYVAGFVVALLFYVNSTFDETIVIDNVITNSNIVLLGILLGLIAMVSWLFNKQMEKSLRRAEKSEAALLNQNERLETMVEKRTEKLQTLQMEQLQQVYHFAELGILSTALLHDLASHLNVIASDLEGLPKESSSKILERIKHTISYIDASVDKTRKHLEGNQTIKRFDINEALNEVVKLLSYKAEKADVRLEVVVDKEASPTMKGDGTRFKQLMTNLITNAIESYDKHHRNREVIISTAVTGSTLSISVIDHGVGITETQRAEIFQPFYTTKEKSMGLGLFIAKKIAEESFGGTLKTASDKGHGAVFAVKIPLRK